MAKSIRVSDKLYAAAEENALLCSRSLAQQIEHWANIGIALERAGVSVAHVVQILKVDEDRGDLVMSLAKRDYQERSRRDVRSGKLKREDLHLIPPELARKAVIHYKG